MGLSFSQRQVMGGQERHVSPEAEETVLEVETVLRRILWEFCCECWKGEYAFI